MRESQEKSPARRRPRRVRSRRGHCPVRATIAVLEQKWTLAIIMALLKGSRRFTELAEVTPGLNTRTLTERLRNLEGIGIVDRHETETPRPSVEYSLTEKGRELKSVIRSISRWGRRYMEIPKREPALN